MLDLGQSFHEVLRSEQVALALGYLNLGQIVARYAKSSAISAANSLCTT